MKKEKFPKRCRACRHFLELNAREYICNYIDNADEPRGCPIDESCTRYEKRERVRRFNLVV